MAKPKTTKPTKPTKPAGTMMEQMDGLAGELGLTESMIFRPVPSGMDVLDYFNARYFTMENERGEPTQELFVGFPIGKLIYLVGFTGCGKTSLAVQVGMNMVQPYELSRLYHFDLENAFSIERAAEVCGMTTADAKSHYTRYGQTSIEKIYTFVKKLIMIKRAAMQDPESEIWVDDVRTGAKIPVPTVVLIDTVLALQSEEVLMDKTEMGSILAEPGAQAKRNNTFAQRLAGVIGEVNITIIAVNHIRDNIQEGPMRKAKRVQYLGADENVPGGSGFPQLADYFLKMAPVDSLDPSEGYAISGKVVRGTIVKSRLSYDGRKFELIFTDDGFSNTWTNFHFLKAQKAVGGAGIGMYIEAPDGTKTRKFAQRQFAGLYENDQEFQAIVNARLEAELLAIVPEPGTMTDAFLSDEEEELQTGAEG